MEPPSTGNVTVLNQSPRRVRLADIRRAAHTALSRHGHSEAQVCVLLTDDLHIRQLNRDFRGIDEATDVLTFPAPSPPSVRASGDIAISVEYALRQAEARGVRLSQELGYLAIHGALHLAGYDDISESDRLAMVEEMNETAIASGLKPDANWFSLLHGVQAI